MGFTKLINQGMLVDRTDYSDILEAIMTCIVLRTPRNQPTNHNTT